METATSGRELLEAGRLRDARIAFWTEVATAEADDDVGAQALAALGLGGVWVHEQRSTLDQARVAEVQGRALDRLDQRCALAHRLRVRLAAERVYITGDTASVLSELEQTRRDGDPLALAEALSVAHHCLLGPHHGSLRRALAEELIALSPRTNRRFDGSMGLAWRTIDMLLAGDRRGSRALLELRERLAVDHCECLEYLVEALDVMMATRAGRLSEAERMAEACFTRGVDVGDADALGWYGAQMVAIRWAQGRGGELLATITDIEHSTSLAENNDGFLAAAAALSASAGDLEPARGALARLRGAGLAAVPSSSAWMATMLGTCEAAHALDDSEVAAEAYDVFVPFAALPAMASLGVACFGSAHRPLGLAAKTMGDIDRATAHFEAAAAADRALGNGPCHAVDIATLAEALDQRDGAGDVERATSLWRSAVDEAVRFEMTDRARAWRLRADERAVARGVVCRRDGRVWHVGFRDREVLVPDSVGMGYVAQLIDRAGTAIGALELASGHALSCRGSPGEPVIDERARAEYRQRINELRDEIDDADVCADIERAGRARMELDRYLEELAHRTGFAGRPRVFDDEAERARVSVRKAIKRAVAAITEADPVAGHMIESRLVTGMRCAFGTGFLPRRSSG